MLQQAAKAIWTTELLARSKVPLTSTHATALYKYMEMMLQTNEKMNLTTITKPDDVLSRHFVVSSFFIIFDLEFCANKVALSHS
jgi:16S rRNA G527 N7-methylase RsmG